MYQLSLTSESLVTHRVETDQIVSTSILDYGDGIWDNCIQEEIQDIEKFQIEAARIVTGTTKLVSINSLYEETGWETLETRRKNHKLTLFFKMINGLSPQYL